MRELIQRTRETILAAPDTICLERARLATEGYQLYGDEPIALCRAKTFRHILENMTLDLDTNPVFAGNTSSGPRAWMLLPEYGFRIPEQAVVENPSLEGFLDGDAVPDDPRSFWADKSFGGGAGIGHLAVNLSRVLSEGLEGIVREVDSHWSESNSEEANYRRAMSIACEAVIAWAKRHAKAAGEAAKIQSDPTVKKTLSRVADACDRVPAKPARDLFEALQAIALVHLAIHIEGHGYSVSPGLLDRVLLPYHEDKAETTELLAAFMLKLSANSLWGSHSKTQTITLGGLDEHGRDMCNPLTMRFLDACELIRMPEPLVFLRWHEQMDDAVKDRAIELLGGGLSMPMLIGDEQTVEGFLRMGVAPEDAWNYCVIGCNELGVPGKVADSATGPLLNDAALLNEALFSMGTPDAVRDMSDLIATVRGRMKAHLARVLKNHVNARARMADEVPTPFTSSLMDGCVRHGCDMHAGMTYSLPCIMERGFTNAVNGLAAIEDAVFEKKCLRLAELIQALKDDFSDETIRARLLETPKWGNDDDRADKWARAWLEMRGEVVREVERELGDRRHVVNHVIRSLHHVSGRQLGATPDGRRAYTPLADSIGAQAGTALEGPTALLNSVIRLEPAKYWPGGYNLNLTLSKIADSDEDMRNNVKALAEAFFADGGQELQIGCLDADMLRDAKRNPEKYQDLLVRIAGFNALFVNLSPDQQEELIARAEMLP